MSNLIKKVKIMQQDGTFTDYIPLGAEAENINVDGESVEVKLNKKPYYYDTVADMKADTKLKAGDMAVTLGYYSANDGGGAEYIIVTSSSNYSETLNNNLVAELIIKDKVTPEQFGAKGDGTTDDTTSLTSMFPWRKLLLASFALIPSLVLDATYQARSITLETFCISGITPLDS